MILQHLLLALNDSFLGPFDEGLIIRCQLESYLQVPGSTDGTGQLGTDDLAFLYVGFQLLVQGLGLCQVPVQFLTLNYVLLTHVTVVQYQIQSLIGYLSSFLCHNSYLLPVLIGTLRCLHPSAIAGHLVGSHHSPHAYAVVIVHITKEKTSFLFGYTITNLCQSAPRRGKGCAKGESQRHLCAELNIVISNIKNASPNSIFNSFVNIIDFQLSENVLAMSIDRMKANVFFESNLFSHFAKSNLS